MPEVTPPNNTPFITEEKHSGVERYLLQIGQLNSTVPTPELTAVFLRLLTELRVHPILRAGVEGCNQLIAAFPGIAFKRPLAMHITQQIDEYLPKEQLHPALAMRLKR